MYQEKRMELLMNSQESHITEQIIELLNKVTANETKR